MRLTGLMGVVTIGLQGETAMGLEFHLHEYDALRAEILDKMRRIEQALRFTIAADAAVMAWILSAIKLNRNFTYGFASWLPLIVTTTFFIYAVQNRNSIAKLGRYLFLVEERYADDGAGWEHRKQLLPELFRGRKRWTSAPAFLFALLISALFGLSCTVYVLDGNFTIFGLEGLMAFIPWKP
jgi:hypothetical protein